MPLGRTVDILRSGARGTRPQGPGHCRDCGNKVWWCVRADGQAVPFDVNPDPIVRSGDIETVSADHLHWRTCPQAPAFRRTRPAGEQPPDPRLPED